MVNPRLLRRRDVPDWSLRHWIRWRYLWWFPIRGEIHTAYLDVRARLGGWCNNCPATSNEHGGGYGHWRCALRRGHDGRLHRFENYVWTDDGNTDYLPVPGGKHDVGAASPWARRHSRGSYRHRLQRLAR